MSVFGGKKSKKKKNKGNVSTNPVSGFETPVTRVKKKVTHRKMDKTFDFSYVLNKNLVPGDDLAMINKITDDEFQYGLVKGDILADNGKFQIMRSPYGLAFKQYDGDMGLGGLGDLPELKEGMFIDTSGKYSDGLTPPKLPRKALETVIEWYRRITEKNGEEAQASFYWNRDKIETVTKDDIEYRLDEIEGVHIWSDEIFSYTPLQHNSPTLTEVANDDEWYDFFTGFFGVFIETHSHNSMKAFMSGTDFDNSGNDGFQLVFGELNTATPQMYSWATIGSVLKDGLSQEELENFIEWNPTTVFNATTSSSAYQACDFEFDESLFDAWDDRVIQRPIRTTYFGQTFPSVKTTTGNYTPYTPYTQYASRYSKIGDDEVLNQVKSEFISAVSDFRKDDTALVFTNEEVLALLLLAYEMGYNTKKRLGDWVTQYKVDENIKNVGIDALSLHGYLQYDERMKLSDFEEQLNDSLDY